MFSRGRPSLSTARTQTISAWLESSPPETPITTFSMPVARRRWTRPATWMSNASAQRSSRSPLSAGTYGKRGISRSSATAAAGRSTATLTRRNRPAADSRRAASRKVDMRSRSCASRSRSRSAMRIWASWLKRSDSASRSPFS